MCFNHDNNEMKFCQIKLLYTCKTTYCWHFTTKIQMQFLVSNCRMLLNFIVIKDPVTFIADNYSKACSVLCQLKCCRAYISSWKRYRLGVPFMRHDLFSKQLQKKERALTLAMFCCFFFPNFSANQRAVSRTWILSACRCFVFWTASEPMEITWFTSRLQLSL